MRHLIVSAVASAALVSVSALALAQGSDKGSEPAAKSEAQPGAQGQGPGSQGPGQAPGRADSDEPKGKAKGQAERAEPKGQAKGQAERSESGKGKASEGKQQRTTQPGDRPDAGKKAESKQTQGKDAKQDKAADKDRSMDKAADKDRSKDKQRTTDQPGKGPSTATQGKQPGKDADQASGRQQASRVQVTEEQRGRVRERLFKDGKVERTKINVSINIGTRIPRSVRLRPVPAAIIEFAPAYRGHSYVVLEDETICIVDSSSYVIVDVIPTSSQRADRPGGGRQALSISQEQMRFVYTTVPKERKANVRIKLALGAEIPRDVELVSFPGEVIERVPELREYRYIVVEDQVVVVDPREHGIALVINE
jgi:hypothetical protein